MSNPVSLKQIEKEAHRTFNQDGLLYLFMAVLLAAVGISFYDARFGFLGGLAALLVFPVEWFRRRITYPRVGYARFGLSSGFARGLLGFAVMAVAVLVFFAFFDDGRLAQYLPFIIGGVFALAFYFGASVQGVRGRDWLVIGLIVATSVITMGRFADWHTAVAVQMWFLAGILLLIGLIDLVRFLKTHPVVESSSEKEV